LNNTTCSPFIISTTRIITMTNVHFQIISDIHLEFKNVLSELPKEALEPKAPYLVLLGDIGYPSDPKYEQFILAQAEKFKRVFVLAGNHEFYNAEYYSTKKKIQEICSKKDNITFLDKTSVLVDGVRVLGTTLWSNIPEKWKRDVYLGLNDYRCINVENQETKENDRLSVEQSVAWFQDELGWLKEQILLAREKQGKEKEKVVIFTHHAPSMKRTSDPRYEGSPCNCAFATDLELLMGGPVRLWCFGHTHFSSDQFINGTRVVSNQVGYIVNGEKTGFTPGKVVSV